MSSTQGRLFDEFAKLMNDAAGVAQSARREMETVMRAQGDRVISELDLVRREDLEVVQEIAAKALAEVERLTQRVADLEARLGATGTATAVVDTGPAPDGASAGA